MLYPKVNRVIVEFAGAGLSDTHEVPSLTPELNFGGGGIIGVQDKEIVVGMLINTFVLGVQVFLAAMILGKNIRSLIKMS